MKSPYNSDLRESKKIISKKLEGKKFDSVLEIGSQWGENLVAIRENFSDKKIVGIDIDAETTEEAGKITGLDLRVEDAFYMDFKKDEFDIVFTYALFCMIPPVRIRILLKNIVEVARKYIILIEFETKEKIGITPGNRTGANWIELFKELGLKATREKLKINVEEPNSWVSYGYIYIVEK